jgi:pyrroloquinoline-quinone synthase
MGMDTIVADRHLLKHPFYQRWQAGKVPLAVLQDYATQYYHYESALPSFLESAIGHLDGPAKEALAGVLSDETSKPEPHAVMWLRFADAIGAEAEGVTASEPTPKTANLVATYRSLCRHGAEEALAALYAYESQFPEIARAKAGGLREFYGMTDEGAGLEFFDLHSTLDVEHAKAIRSALVDSEPAREAAHLALDAWWGMLDQFEAAAGSAVG